MSTSRQYVLFQYGADPLNYYFEDSEERVAFTSSVVVQVPNVVVQLTRQEEWAQQYTDVLGPRSAFLYFGPSNSPGQVAYGNGGRVPMSYYLRKKKEGSNSRYFNAQGGKELKWKFVSSQRMELCDSLTTFAAWEKAAPGSEHDAQVTLETTGLLVMGCDVTFNEYAAATITKYTLVDAAHEFNGCSSPLNLTYSLPNKIVLSFSPAFTHPRALFDEIG